jgi:predicted nucleotidyltransferase
VSVRKEKLTPTIEEVKEKAVPILQRHGAIRAGVFGSMVRGEMRKRSDIDILVELDSGLSLLDVIGIEQELEDALGRSVDLVEYEAIKAQIRERILAEEVRIL